MTRSLIERRKTNHLQSLHVAVHLYLVFAFTILTIYTTLVSVDGSSRLSIVARAIISNPQITLLNQLHIIQFSY